MKKFLRNSLLLALCVTGVLIWMTVRLGGELRDWLDSDTWATTPSAGLTIRPKVSEVRYSYMVDGQTYSSDRTHFFMKAPYDDERHLEWLHAHRRTPTVTVYYDPDAPRRAVLVREVDSFWLVQLPLALVYGCLIILLPILFFGFIWQRLLR